MLTSQELHEQLSQCYGTEHYYKDGLLPYLYTDGVKTFVEGAGAYWFLTELLSFIEIFKNNYMTVIKMTVKNEKADIELIDDNDKLVKTKHISYTDCPDGEYRFYMYWQDMEKPTLIWYMEY